MEGGVCHSGKEPGLEMIRNNRMLLFRMNIEGIIAFFGKSCFINAKSRCNGKWAPEGKAS